MSILGILFYSIRISRYPFIGNFLSVALSIAPFFAITLYYKYLCVNMKNQDITVLVSLGLDEVYKGKTIRLNYELQKDGVKFGEKTTKAYISFYIIITCSISIWILINHSPSLVVYYYTLVIPFFIFFTYFLWEFNSFCTESE